MQTNAPAAPADKPLWDTLKQDWRYVRDDVRPGWRAMFRSTMTELKEFYLTPEHRQRLAGMGPAKRGLWLGGWLLKSLFLKLTPLRRFIFLAALILLVSSPRIATTGGTNVSLDGEMFGVVLLVALLLLELKDKLLARHELEAGRAVQRALMPERCPTLAGWDVWLYTRPANDVGGDLVDCLELGPGRVGFTLADVAGKALPAALLMAKVQSTLRALATDAPSLSALAAKTNDILCRDGLPNRFATLVYFDLRDDDGAVRLVNGGHMPPVLVSRGGFHELPRGDMALGWMPGAAYREQRQDVQPGEMLIAYSDGLTEALNAAGEFYGEDRLRAVFAELGPLSAKDAGARILGSVDAFIGATRPYDDLSLIVLNRT
ncbi:MAG: PP2C family protein-serine/threonine phosphatase [Rhodospirillaceae bacterium]